jgi:hypothetical protein
MYEGVYVQIHVFLTLALGGEWSASWPGRVTPRERDPGKGKVKLSLCLTN